jgi:proteic killer suppression protein
MILTFSDKDTEELFRTERNKRFSQISRVAARKLTALHAAEDLADLLVPPGNRLEALKGKRSEWHSIRINDQWRIIFRWTEKGPSDVAITDYH